MDARDLIDVRYPAPLMLRESQGEGTMTDSEGKQHECLISTGIPGGAFIFEYRGAFAVLKANDFCKLAAEMIDEKIEGS